MTESVAGVPVHDDRLGRLKPRVAHLTVALLAIGGTAAVAVLTIFRYVSDDMVLAAAVVLIPSVLLIGQDTRLWVARMAMFGPIGVVFCMVVLRLIRQEGMA